MKKLFLSLSGAIIFNLIFAQTAVKIDSLGLNNLYKIDEGVYRSEQPQAQHFKALEHLGITETLNLRHYHSDEKKAKGTNLTLHRLRMDAHKIHDQDVIDALKIIKNRNGSILIHCRHGSDRTGVVIAMYRIVFQNWSKEAALEEMQSDKFGFHPIYKNIPVYIKNVDVDYIRRKVEK